MIKHNKTISVIIACYKDELAIPVMYDRITKVFSKINYSYEIIFVNDASPDNSKEKIMELSKKDNRVKGITHTRNFGSQSAFLSGMDFASGDGIVLMDGDLQDPPELIEDFIEKWENGYEVVYGVRTTREAPIYMQILYKLYYKIFSKLSTFSIPKDAGDFSLIDQKVAKYILNLKEREPFIRALRAFYGGNSVGVNYRRPKRLYGKSTNNFIKNLGWATKGLLAVSRIPLNILILISTIFVIPMILTFIVIFELTSSDNTLLMNEIILVILCIVILQNSVMSLYLGKIFEDIKQRPHYLRKSTIINGEEIET
jgi:glycosyltransferase involved in cell wall biosynthesis